MSKFKQYLRQALNEQLGFVVQPPVLPEPGDCYWVESCTSGTTGPVICVWEHWCWNGTGWEQDQSSPDKPACCSDGSCDCRKELPWTPPVDDDPSGPGVGHGGMFNTFSNKGIQFRGL